MKKKKKTLVRFGKILCPSVAWKKALVKVKKLCSFSSNILVFPRKRTFQLTSISRPDINLTSSNWAENRPCISVGFACRSY